MLALFNKLLDWFKALFWKEEMELTLVGLQYSGKTTFVNVIAVRYQGTRRPHGSFLVILSCALNANSHLLPHVTEMNGL